MNLDGVFSQVLFKEKVFSKACCSHASFPTCAVPPSFLATICSGATRLMSEQIVWDLGRVIDHKWWLACGLEKLHCPRNTVYLLPHRFRQTYFPSICCFSSCFSVFFALAVLARSSRSIFTLSPVHKQIKVLADNTAFSLLQDKAQMPLRMPSAASHVHGATQEWEQLNDWALYCSSCGA